MTPRRDSGKRTPVRARRAVRRTMRAIPFTVASALLSELGERLVGKPHIALAELVKNSYDADATKVIVGFNSDRIEVVDNGHGMDFEEFRDFWMRIGTPHKQEQRVSRRLERPMTGSKGVGRLAVQFLARGLELYTVSEKRGRSELRASVNWDEAVQAGELTQAVARYEEVRRTTEFPTGSNHGTAIILSGMKQDWTPKDIENLAREIWWLQPPFRSNPDLTIDAQKIFEVELRSQSEEAVRRFGLQMRASLDTWHARLVGKLTDATQDNNGGQRSARLSVEFADGTQANTEYSIPECKLHAAEFEIRVFHLQYRQPFGVRVEEARKYLKEFGGVHVYDTGFNLPFYGPDTDWLRIEIDHSHRLSASELLPHQLQIKDGLSFLPTQSRLFGVVHVNTSRERDEARKRGAGEEYLKISVTRDRLVDNKAFQDLRYMVRWALDFYAMQETRRQLAEAEAIQAIEPAQMKFERVDQVLEEYKNEIPESAYATLRTQIQGAIEASETEAEVMARQVGLLGSLATAGISALAYEHEVRKQFHLLEEVVEQIKEVRVKDARVRHFLNGLADRLGEWLNRARATRTLFSYLIDEEARETRARFKARRLIDEVGIQMGVLLRGINIDTSSIDESLRLPEGRFAEWSAIFQNVFLNAVNAMLDVESKHISVVSRAHGRTRAILVQDTGCGVDLTSAEDLFKPFVRRLALSPERRALGLGGSGLGLTIVRMIAQNLSCKVAFVEPAEGFSATLRLSWSEKE